jgi:rhodanese-related sulfurtransferase
LKCRFKYEAFMDRRLFLLSSCAAVLLPVFARAATPEIWSASDAAKALAKNEISLIDVRSRPEWLETGIAAGAWPISLHEGHFERRLFAARDLSGPRPVALICATGGRSARLLNALTKAGYEGFIDVSEGMLGSRRGPGWIARGLTTVDIETALSAMPDELH